MSRYTRNLFITLAVTFAATVVKAQTSQPSPTPAPTSEAAPTAVPVAEVSKEEGHKTKFTVGLALLSPGGAGFANAKVTTGGTTESGTVAFNTNGGAALVLEVRRMEEHSWGFQAGAQIESWREVRDMKYTTGSTTTTVTYSRAPKFRSEVIYGNAIYRWGKVYLPFGLNVSIPHVDVGAGSTTTVTPAVGTQVGVGFQFTKLFSLEVMGQATGVQMKETTDTYTADYGTGYLFDLRVAGKFSF